MTHQGEVASKPRLWAILVTYRRTVELEASLAALKTQERRPDELLVVDNAPGPATRSVVADYPSARYVPLGENCGPAGGVAHGMQLVLQEADDEDWCVLLDDDDPPVQPGSIATLWELALRLRSADPSVAGVGTSGARYDRRTGRLVRIRDSELRGLVAVDYLAGSSLPMYRCGVIRSVGPFAAPLFFGFEELEYGLRLVAAGHHLRVHGDVWREMRRLHGRLDLVPARLRNPSNTAAWRRYYSTRNLVFIARRYAGTWSAGRVGLRDCLAGTVGLIRSRRPVAELVLPVRGLVDGWRSRLGRTVDPGDARKTV